MVSHFKFTNYREDDNDNRINLIKGYKIDNDSYTEVIDNTLEYENNHNLTDLSLPIKQLLKIKFNSSFVINGYKVIFNYSINNSTIKKLEYQVDDVIFCTDQYEFNYNYGTKFDEESNEVINVISQDAGFYIPKSAIGYYEIIFVIMSDYNFMTFKIKNSFNFIASPSELTSIKLNSTWINNLKNFIKIEV